jgi:hypothetical protein
MLHPVHNAVHVVAQQQLTACLGSWIKFRGRSIVLVQLGLVALQAGGYNSNCRLSIVDKKRANLAKTKSWVRC